MININELFEKYQSLIDKISEANTLEEILTLCLKIITNLSNLEYGAIYLLDNNKNLILANSYNLEKENIDINLKIDNTVLDGNSLYINKQDLNFKNYFLKKDTKLIAAIPIKFRKSIIGVFVLGSDKIIDVDKFMLESFVKQFSILIGNFKLEHDLTQSQNNLKKLFDIYPDGIILTDYYGHIIDTNLTFLEITSFNKEEILNKHIFDILNYYDIEELLTLTRFKSKNANILTKDNNYIPIEFWVNVLDNNTYIFFIKDLKYLKTKEYELSTAIKRFETVIENTPNIAIQGMDKDGVILYWNKASEEFYGFSKSEAIGKKIQDLIFTDNKEEKEIFEKELQNIWQSKQGNILKEWELINKDGKKLYVYSSLFPIVENNKVVEVFCIDIDVTILKETELKLKKSLKENEVLIKEIHHRVKNNLQIISSLIFLQSLKISCKDTVNILQDIYNRIKSMSIIHEKLYKSNDYSSLSFKDYVIDIINNLIYSYKINTNLIKVNINVDKVFLNVNIAIPCGLIINELVSNAFKYAFKDGYGNLDINFYSDTNHIILIKDNGTGLPANIDINKPSTFGLELINILVKQLNGKVSFINDNGLKVVITFPKAE